MNFLDFIFDNLFIVIIIVVGLFNFLSSMGKKKQNENSSQKQTQHQNNKPSTPRPIERRMESASERMEERIENVGRKMEEKLEEYSQRLEPKSDTKQQTIAEQQKAQYERLKRNVKKVMSGHEHKRYNTEEHKANLKDAPPVEHAPSIQKRNKPKEINGLHLEDKLTPRGLIDSVIMAEVLGPPRAHDPYQSVASKRKRP